MDDASEDFSGRLVGVGMEIYSERFTYKNVQL